MTEAAEGASAILGLVAVMWVIAAIVFGPGRITAHRVRGQSCFISRWLLCSLGSTG